MTLPDARIILDARNIVGESIIWSPDEKCLYWVDIVGSAIHRLDPISGQHDKWATPELPTSIGLRRGGGFIVGLRRRVTLWSPGDAFQTLAVPEPDLPNNRLNEGVVAPDGSFWVGTMRDNIASDGSPMHALERTGRLYRIAPDGAVAGLADHIFGITNTMIWMDDGGFVTADTAVNELYRFDHDPIGHRLIDPTRIAEGLVQGLPDGSTRDTLGAIYNCRVAGGSAVAILSSDLNEAGNIALPCQSPTSCTFGGADLSTLFVTSARFGMDDMHLQRFPNEGAVMAVDLQRKGLPPRYFG